MVKGKNCSDDILYNYEQLCGGYSSDAENAIYERHRLLTSSPDCFHVILLDTIPTRLNCDLVTIVQSPPCTYDKG